MRTVIALIGSALCLLACDPGVTLGTPCEYTSQCPDPLACVIGRCRQQCLGYRDCPAGSRCLVDASGVNVCRLADESSCSASATCPATTECRADVCVAICATSDACGGTECLATGVCEEPEDTRVTCEGLACGSGVCSATACDDYEGIAPGGLFTCARRASGGVDCAGSDASGSLGDGPPEMPSPIRPALAPIAGMADAIQLGTGWEHGCALAGSGEVRCWGRGDEGQVGTSSSTDAPAIVIEAAAGDARVVAIGVGLYHSCAVRASGRVVCWGRNDLAQLGDGMDHVGGCEESTHDCSDVPVDVLGIDDAIAIDAHAYVTCVIRRSGALSCWGRADLGQLGASPAGAEPCTENDSADPALCVPAPVTIAGAEGASSVTLGREHACVLVAGEVLCWGLNANGQVGVAGEPVVQPTRVALPVAAERVVAGTYHTCAQLVDGSVHCWGMNDEGQLAIDPAISGRADRPARVAALPRAIDLAAGSFTTCVRTQDREMWCWGKDEEGNLADGVAGAPGFVPRRALRAPL